MGHPQRELRPYRIGAMIDLPGYPGYTDMFPDAVEFALQEAYQSGLIDRPVEVIRRVFFAQPWDGAEPAIEAYLDLCNREQVLGIAGGIITDNSLALLPAIERRGVPLISNCGSQLFVGHNAFSLSNGGMGDEPAVMAAWLRSQGLRRIAVIKESPSQIGEEYAYYLRLSARMEKLAIVSEYGVAPVAEIDEIVAGLTQLRASNADALVYLGLGLLPGKLKQALAHMDWHPPRIMSTAFVAAMYNQALLPDYEGWVGVDQYHEGNTVLSRLVARAADKGRKLVANTGTSVGYDAGNVLAIALSRMRIATPAALRDALETVRMIPAATGAPGTIITFGPQDHRGYKGVGFLTLRRGLADRTELVGIAPL
ncbi:MAG: ABC transporter substrate-binding protein [Gammaproteobacteria bacterium]